MEILRARPDELVETSGSHYRVIAGGELDGTSRDSPRDILNYLYALLVSEGGFSEALGGEQVDADEPILRSEVATAFRRYEILGDSPLLVPHPILTDEPIMGQKNVAHRPSFVQHNGQLFIIEAVDFTNRFKKRARDHAGWSAYMFDDVRAVQHDRLSAIAVVKFTTEDVAIDYVESGLAMLRAEANEVINWHERQEREQFLDVRRRIALMSE